MHCVRGVLCVFSQCAAKGRSVSEVSAVNGGRGTPATAGRRLPPLRALRQNAPGLNKTGAKGFVSASLPSSSPGIPGNQV